MQLYEFQDINLTNSIYAESLKRVGSAYSFIIKCLFSAAYDC